MQPTFDPRSDTPNRKTTKKSVLICITKASWGGAQQYVYDLATNLPADQYEVVVSVGGTGDLTERLQSAGITVRSIESLERDVTITNEIAAIKQMAALIREIKPDIIHSTSSKTGIIGTVLGRLLGVDRVIFTACAWAFNEDRPAWQKLVIKGIHWVNVMLAHESIALSHGLRAQMNWPLAQKKLHVIHLGRTLSAVAARPVARDALCAQAASKRLALPHNPSDLWIGSIAELHHIKRINVLIDAVKELVPTFPTIRYVAIHDGEERANLEQQISDLDLSKHVFLVGKIPNAATLIPAFDVFVLPSKSEAFGYVLVEAGLAGVAVVASNVGGIPDVVINAETGLLVEPNNPITLAEAIKTLLDDEVYRAELAEAHHKRSQQFTVEAMMDKTLALYNST